MGTGMPLQCPPSAPWGCAGTGSPSGLVLCPAITPLASHLPFWSCFLRGFSTSPSRLLLQQCSFPRGVPAAPHSIGMRGAGNSARLSQVRSSLQRILLCGEEGAAVGGAGARAPKATAGHQLCFPSSPTKTSGRANSFTFKCLPLSA